MDPLRTLVVHLLRSDPATFAELVLDLQDVPLSVDAQLARARCVELHDWWTLDDRPDVVIEIPSVIESAAAMVVLDVEVAPAHGRWLSWAYHHAAVAAYHPIVHRADPVVSTVVVAVDPAVEAWAGERRVDDDGEAATWVLGPARLPRVARGARLRGSPALTLLAALAHAGADDVAAEVAVAEAAELAAVHRARVHALLEARIGTTRLAALVAAAARR